MTDLAFALKSLVFHRRVNLAVALGVAAATAVLTGALIVGDSMRGSLRGITLDRLGRIDILLTSDGFFREDLASEIASSADFAQEFTLASPAIFFPNGTAELRDDVALKNAGEVNVLGIQESFWELGDDDVRPLQQIGDDQVVINQVLADDLSITRELVRNGNVQITIGVPKQKLLPSDSALGDKDDLVERMVNLQVLDIIPATSLGRFGLHPTQIPPRNAFVSIRTMQSALTEGILKYKQSPQQANLVLIAGKSPARPPDSAAVERLAESIQPTAEDLGLRVKRVTQSFQNSTVFDYFSVTSDHLVIPLEGAQSIQRAFPTAQPMFTYLANDISKLDESGQPVAKGIPFSMILSSDYQALFGEAGPPGENSIALNSWAASDLGVRPGDQVRVTFFEPETTHGDEIETTVDLEVSAILPVTHPDEPFQVGRRGRVTPARYEQRPTIANDPDMTPEVPGLTDAESIERWDLPFDTASALRPQDDDYWDYYRTTPKGFVNLGTGRQLWSSRFGDTTSFRIDVEDGNPLDQSTIAKRIVQQFRDDGHLLGMQVVPIKSNGLAASSGSTPFDALFLGLSMFVIGAALILVSLLFRLGLQQRSDELGTLMASGFRQKRIGKLWLLEMMGVCLSGAVLGILLGLGYAALMLLGLQTWWVGAITTPFLSMHLSWWTLPLGLLCGSVICVLTIGWSIRRARKQSVRNLLSGQIESSSSQWLSPRLARIFVVAAVAVALVLTVLAATALAGESQAGAFMTAGFLVLVAALLWIWQTLLAGSGGAQLTRLSVNQLAWTSAGRNPLRSTLTIGLVAVASFLILAISAFRLAPTMEGTAGFNWVAKTSQPVFANLNNAEGQSSVLRGEMKQLNPDSRVMSFRYKSGEDASCNNPYQSSQPQVLGVTREMVEYFSNPDVEQFSFSMTPGENPWEWLFAKPQDDAIPVIIDKNTAWYSLKVYLPDTVFSVEYDSGQTVQFRLVGLLNNSVLQGSLLIAEDQFTRVFPDISGYRYFLLKTQPTEMDALANALSDQGFDARGADKLLEGFLAVQNTYLSTFQSLGALGLLLGTFGLAAVQLRSVMERRQELGLMRAVGFSRSQLARLIVLENAWLLMVGLGIGIGAALFTTLPHYFFGNATVPLREMIVMFGIIVLVGMLTSWLASRSVFKAPLIESLRAA